MQAKFSSATESVSVPRPASAPAPHNLIIENRSSVTATGVTRILSCDEGGASLETQQGGLVIGGSGIQVSELSVQTGEVKIYGKIEYVQYTERREPAGSFFKRLVR